MFLKFAHSFLFPIGKLRHQLSPGAFTLFIYKTHDAMNILVCLPMFALLQEAESNSIINLAHPITTKKYFFWRPERA